MTGSNICSIANTRSATPISLAATRAKIAEVMRYKVIPLLAEYFYEDWSKVATVLGDAAQDKPKFLVREVMTMPAGLDPDAFSGARDRWRVRPEVEGDQDGGFDFTEFGA